MINSNLDFTGNQNPYKLIQNAGKSRRRISRRRISRRRIKSYKRLKRNKRSRRCKH